MCAAAGWLANGLDPCSLPAAGFGSPCSMCAEGSMQPGDLTRMPPDEQPMQRPCGLLAVV
jgi:hypothetical protein